MINIDVNTNDINAVIEITGHANYNTGNDIVCSAVSAISMLFVGATRAIGMLKSYRAESGDYIAEINVNRDSRTILNATIIGLLQIEKTYPENVKMCLNGKNPLSK